MQMAHWSVIMEHMDPAMKTASQILLASADRPSAVTPTPRAFVEHLFPEWTVRVEGGLPDRRFLLLEHPDGRWAFVPVNMVTEVTFASERSCSIDEEESEPDVVERTMTWQERGPEGRRSQAISDLSDSHVAPSVGHLLTAVTSGRCDPVHVHAAAVLLDTFATTEAAAAEAMLLALHSSTLNQRVAEVRADSRQWRTVPPRVNGDPATDPRVEWKVQRSAGMSGWVPGLPVDPALLPQAIEYTNAYRRAELARARRAPYGSTHAGSARVVDASGAVIHEGTGFSA